MRALTVATLQVMVFSPVLRALSRSQDYVIPWLFDIMLEEISTHTHACACLARSSSGFGHDEVTIIVGD